MKFLLLPIISLSVTGCIGGGAFMGPDHFSLTPSVEWAIQEGEKTTTKPAVELSLDWNM